MQRCVLLDTDLKSFTRAKLLTVRSRLPRLGAECATIRAEIGQNMSESKRMKTTIKMKMIMERYSIINSPLTLKL